MRTGHVGINVTDLARSTAFYQEIFGFDLIGGQADGERRFAFLGHGDDLVLTLWQQSDGQFATNTPGLHHLAFLVDGLDEVRAAEAKVRGSGMQLFHDGVVAHREGAQSGGIFFSDPDGIRLEVYAESGVGVAAAPAGDEPTCGFF